MLDSCHAATVLFSLLGRNSNSANGTSKILTFQQHAGDANGRG